MSINSFKLINEKYNIDLLLLFIFLVSLPIGGVSAIQNLSFLFFSISVLVSFRKDLLIDFLSLKSFLVIFLSFLFLSLFSTFYSISSEETLSEVRGEIIKPFFVLFISFIFFSLSSNEKIKKIITVILVILMIHSLLNLIMWYQGGFWPFRAGGLLDNGGGERFGIWATYSLSISIALFFTKYKKLGILLFLFFLLSLIANNTRATFVGLILIFISYFIFFYKDKTKKYVSIFIICISMTIFIFYSQNFDKRYNVYNMISNIKYFDDYSPLEYDKLIKEHSLGHSSVARLAMWKTVILYRFEHPLIPLGYGRFLYDKQIKEIWKNNPENIPYKLYRQAHSDFFSILLSLGIIGLFIFIIFLLYLLKVSYYIYKNNININIKFLGVFVFLGTIGYISSMTFGSFFGDSEQLYFYMLYGMILALYFKTKRELSVI